MNVHKRIRILRTDNDLSQAEVAALLNVGQRTYCDYELGKTRIPVESLLILARKYNVSMDYICGVADERGEFPRNAQ